MNNLVIVENDKAITNSLLVAQGFGKQHKDVLETVRNLTTENPTLIQRAENSAGSMFVERMVTTIR